ncbi:unnamed protein product [Acanthoscelides obtectus]|uniref:Uncharacterized protein n=1 Tax=Acanthoscelides obtectus TaxID=200917 RepID=A0A9P0L7W8_ACAOB|nr:unnamed protein product [Acanthoscelides obtectus]CAK1659819.1 hypothetical protein AOBTE_LOCUS21690 [Acanthoscelides obtectus]
MSDEIIGLGKDDMLALKCANCELYLSVPPITMNEGEYYCGRCNIQGTRIEIYEELASHILFPCVNETCTRLLSWGNVANHETNCPHKLICCPFVNCIDVYEANEILVHFEDYHENHLYFENEICFFRRFRNLEFHKFTVDKRAYALSWGDLKYVVMVYMDAKEHRRYDSIDKYNFSFGVYCVQGRTTKNHYNVELTVSWDSGDVQHYLMEYQSILEFKNDYCLNCIQGNCSAEIHNNNKQNFLPTKFHNLKNEYDDMELEVLIYIEEDE